MPIPVITIDGPSGSGKGTIAHKVGKALGWHILDSGAIYRVLAYAVHEQAIPINELNVLAELAASLDVRFDSALNDSSTQIWLGKKNITQAIRTEYIGQKASQVSSIPQVRQALLQRQRDFRQLPGLVTDGRDMGTIVFPDAELKIYLIADASVRAERRYKQLMFQGNDVTLDEVLREIQARDARDASRAVSPLKAAEDAVIINSSAMGIDEVFSAVMDEVVKHDWLT